MVKLDSIDKNIVGLLQEQGRMTNAELSKQVGLSTASALERVKKLERRGVIKGYHAELDNAAIGANLEVLVIVTLSLHQQDAIYKFIAALQDVDEVVDCYHVSGKADFLLRVLARDIPYYETFVMETLSALPGIQHVESMVILSVVKKSNSYPIFSE